MKYTPHAWSLILSLAFGLLACSSHWVGEPMPSVQLRLKTAQGSSLNATYSYDGQNRLATITRTSGNLLNVYRYGDAQNSNRLYQYPSPADQTSGSAILFPYSTNGLTSFATYTYAIFQSNLVIITNSEAYELETNGHLKSVRRGPENVVASPSPFTTNYYSFTYTGENITSVSRYTFRSAEYTSVFEYDSQINPFFESTDPSLDDVQRFSRNNVIRVTTTYPVAPQQTVVYQYEYNQQGLPTRRTTIQGGKDVLTYTYESY